MTPTILYRDSISHRIARVLHAHPEVALSIGQVLAAAQVTADEPPEIPPASSQMSTSPRSGSQQVKSLLLSGLMKREKNFNGRWQYQAGSLRLCECVIRTAPSYVRPGERIARSTPTPAPVQLIQPARRPTVAVQAVAAATEACGSFIF